MISRFLVLGALFISLFVFFAPRVLAQPTLPDIYGVADNGTVMLSWNCQYSGLKSVSVQRSSDSAANYSIIGSVKNVAKGIQSFVDEHPLPGNNYYKLIIVFGSGLNWSSNRFGVVAGKAGRGQHSDQPVVTSKVGGQPAATNQSAARLESNTSFPATAADTAHAQKLKPKMSMGFDDFDNTPSTFVRSRYVSTDPATGHINMNLPDDIAQHAYSIRFFNQQNHMVLEVPRINAPKIILDKRNFQRKGLYKFVLRKDAIELETGYISVNDE